MMPEPNVQSIIQQAIQHYRPGGEFATVRAKQLAEKKGITTAAMESQLVGRGLAGTTLAAGIPAAFEQQIGAPWRTETEMMRGGRLMEAVLAKAGFAERAIARKSAEELARERMDLQRELQDVALSAQERAAKQQRLHEIEMQERQWEQGQVAGAGAEYRTPSAPSLIGAGADAGAGVGADLGPTEFGQYGEYYGAAYEGEIKDIYGPEPAATYYGAGAGPLATAGGVDYGPGSEYQQEKYGEFGAAFPSGAEQVGTPSVVADTGGMTVPEYRKYKYEQLARIKAGGTALTPSAYRGT